MRVLNSLFDNSADAHLAVKQLEAIGIPERDISIVSHHPQATTEAAEGAGIGAGVGAVVGGAGGLLAGLGIMAIPGVGPVVAAGWLAALAVGAVSGAVVGGAAGGLIGAMIESGVSEEDAHTYAEGVRRGGTLVTVKVPDDKYTEADAILKRANSVDISQRREEYVDSGWEKFDEKADPYTVDEVERERERLRNLTL